MRFITVIAVFLFLTGTPVLAQVDLNDLAERVAALEDQAAQQQDGHYLTKLLQGFTVYGFVRLDTAWSDSSMSDNQITQWVNSEDRSRASAGAGTARENDSDFTMYGRLTRLGLGFQAPDKVAGATVTGKIEVDFYGFAGSDSRNDLRMRHAYVNMQWDVWNLFAGQTSDLVSPLYPSVNADLINWNTGNTGDRRPQLRVGARTTVGDGMQISGTIAATEPNAVSTTDTDGDGTLDGEEAGVPLWQGRAALKAPFGDDGQTMELGIWGAIGQEEDQSRSATNGEKTFDVELVGIDARLPLPFLNGGYVKGEVWTGRNVDDLRGGIGQGVSGAGREVQSIGYWVETGAKVARNCKAFAGYSEDNPHNAHIGAGGRTRNQQTYVGAVYSGWKPVVIGCEYLYWWTEWKGIPNGDANRFKLWIAYNF